MPTSLGYNSAGCSLASVKGKTQKKRKRDDDSDEAEAFSDSGSDLGEAQHTQVFFSCNDLNWMARFIESVCCRREDNT